VRSEAFRKARERFGDVASVDILFRRALRMSWNNPYVALAILVPAVMDHDRVGVRLPLFGRLLWFPLTSEFPEEFAARCEAQRLRAVFHRLVVTVGRSMTDA
jgi:hypothetical protein